MLPTRRIIRVWLQRSVVVAPGALGRRPAAHSRRIPGCRTFAASCPVRITDKRQGAMATPQSQSGNTGVTIQLTAVEENLRRLLLDVADHLQRTPATAQPDAQVLPAIQPSDQPTVLRFTGGWVRDKLLGVDSHDIDVAINNMTGYQFGLRMKDFLELPGNLQKYGLDAGPDESGQAKLVGGLHKIEANPEKSKHLETVTTKILGLDIDLVNLRKETYTDDSRNPQMEFGTPEEDALRRDATINAMFYNLNTLQVEDFTLRGFEDMQQKIIRTPLDPYQTFKDDPLRILRLIRFASRLGYTIDPSALESMSDDSIKAVLRVKISRERVGIELEKMLRGPDPLRALELINAAGLYLTVFSDPAVNHHNDEPETATWEHVLQQAGQVIHGRSSLSSLLIQDAEDKYTAWVLACMVPYRNAPQPEAPPGRKALPPVAAQVAREGFRATNKVFDVIVAAVRNAAEISQMASFTASRPTVLDQGTRAKDCERIGMAIRQWGSSWRLQTLFALLAAMADEPSHSQDLIRTYSTFAYRVQELGLSEAYTFRPLFTGKEVATAIGVAPGPWMKDALDVVMAWQLRNPGNTDAAMAVEELKGTSIHGELTADLIKHFLSLTIRPLFANTQHPSLTSQGRRNTARSVNKRTDVSFDEVAAKPWKKKEEQALEFLRWILQSVDQRTLEANWHLLVPPLLSIVDDHQVPFKARGCELITLLLHKTPQNLLLKTGMSKVFHEALMPSFGFLPTLTPEAESVDLLSNAFPALLALHKVSFSAPDQKLDPQYYHYLDTLIRKGVFAVHSNCPENVQITLVLLRNIRLINDLLGYLSAKHLKYSLPMLNEVLCNPFGPASPELMLAAVMALEGVVRNAWPRMSINRGEVLKGLCVSFTNALEADDPEHKLDLFKKEAVNTVMILRRAVEAQMTEKEIRAEFDALIAADQRLADLLR